MIDAHIHCFPETPFSQSKEWAETKNEKYWLSLVNPKNSRSLQSWNSIERTLSVMREAKLDQAILLGWYWEHQSTCIWHNELMASWQKQSPNQFITFASILPNQNVIEQLEYAQSMGFKGVGELHPSIQKFSENKRHWFQMAEWCVQENWPLNLHVTESLNLPHPGYQATPFDCYLELAKQFPELKMILAHWGGGIPFFEQNPKLKPLLKNTFYDTAASPLLYNSDIFKNVIAMVGAEKILFGSDYPLKLYPKTQTQAHTKPFIDEITKETHLSKDDLDAIFSDNIQRLLGTGDRII